MGWQGGWVREVQVVAREVASIYNGINVCCEIGHIDTSECVVVRYGRLEFMYKKRCNTARMCRKDAIESTKVVRALGIELVKWKSGKLRVEDVVDSVQ